jgi:hypothetical protein
MKDGEQMAFILLPVFLLNTVSKIKGRIKKKKNERMTNRRKKDGTL